MVITGVQQRLELSSYAVNLWFGDIEIKSFSGNTLTLTISTTLKKNTVKDKFLPTIEELFEEFIGFHINVIIEERSSTVDVEAIKRQISGKFGEENTTELEEEEKPSLKVGSTMPTVNFEYTFDNFIVGGSNKFAHAACVAVADRSGQGTYNPLFIYGPSGLGKTHLLYAITNEIKRKNPDTNIIYIKSEDFTNQLIESLAKKSVEKFRDKYRTCDVLLIDDIQFIAGKNATQEEFFHTFNALYEEGKQIILTSDRPPKDIKTLEERLRTRFEWGLIADILPPDLELRIAIFKNKISQAKLEVSDEIITYLAENLRSHIRQIEGAVKKLAAIRYLSGREITMDIAKGCMSELLGGEEPLNVTIDKIFAAVERKYDITRAELESTSRVKEVAQARHIAIYLIRSITEMSLKNIGKLFGGRDHATVMSSVEKIDKKIASTPEFEAEISELIKDIKE